MTTTQELCRVLATALHVAGVDRWAEHLEARGLLPGLDRQVCDFDAAAKAVMLDIEKQRRKAEGK